MTEEIVISGISGRYPGCDSVDELRDALFAEKDLITEDESRWPLGFNGVPKRSGKLSQINRFDAQFFGINGIQTNHMDPQLRILLELTVEAILDSGTDPKWLSGTRTGVFIGGHYSGTEFAIMNKGTDFSGSILTGCEPTMLANRISFFLNLHGPSYSLSTACSSSATALDQAVTNIKQGKCDAAIVGGSTLHLNYGVSLAYKRLNMISDDGKCKFLDESADGYVRSEACSVIFLQRSSDAKRIYATIVNTNSNTNGFRAEGITRPSQAIQTQLMETTLKEVNLNPLEVNYIEAHGTGTQAGDQCEMEAIASVYCKNRKTPLMVGTVKTNVGHSEESSGLTSVIKVLIAFESRCIPPIIHLKKYNPNISCLNSGAIEPVIDKMCFEGSIVGINSGGFGGANVHILLRPNTKLNDQSSDELNIARPIPRLINLCGRTKSSVERIINHIENNSKLVTKSFLSLLDNISNVTNMNYRSYIIAKNIQDDKLALIASESIKSIDDKRPLWFVFSGMGTQWPAMAKGLMEYEIFKKSLQNVNEILKDFNIDIIGLSTNEHDIFSQDNIACSLGITAMQIALIDLLNELCITADGYVGHSLGEFVCPYAYGGLSLRQTVLLSYWKAKCIHNGNCKRGLMAAVGLSWEECVKRCPEGVTPVCHNSPDSVTISGEYESTKEFVKCLTDQKIFAKEVQSCELAMHSPLLHHIEPELLSKFKTVIPEPEIRPNKWISSSVKSNNKNKALDYCSAEYYVNNIMSPVWFYEAIQQIPKNAIVVEISPHCLLQSIIKQCLGPDISYIPLMRRNNNSGNAEMILSAIGRLYQLGLKPSISRLYPSVSYPVSRGTQSLSSLIQWDHSDEWFVPLYPDCFNPNKSQEYKVAIDLDKSDDKFYMDHRINGRIIFPFAGYIVIVWQMIANSVGKTFKQVHILMENMKLHRTTVLKRPGQTEFVVNKSNNGEFVVSENNEPVFSGSARIVEEKLSVHGQGFLVKQSSIQLNRKDIYKEFSIRGNDYGKKFQRIRLYNQRSGLGEIVFDGNWVIFLDSLLQTTLISSEYRWPIEPGGIAHFECDPLLLKQPSESSETIMIAYHDQDTRTITTNGIMIKGVENMIAEGKICMQDVSEEVYRVLPYNLNLFDQDLKIFEETCTVYLNSMIGRDAFKQSSSMKQHNNPLYSKNIGMINSIVKTALSHQLNIQDVHGLNCLKFLLETPNLLSIFVQLIRENTLSRSLNILEIATCTKTNLQKTLINNFIKLFVDKDIEHHYSNNEQFSNGYDLIFYNNTDIFCAKQDECQLNNIFANKKDIIRDNGFILVIRRIALIPIERLIFKLLDKQLNDKWNQFDVTLSRYNYVSICKITLSKVLCIELYRKVSPKPISDQTFVLVKTLSYEWIDILKDKLREHESRPLGHNVWLIANDCHYNGVIGLINCLRKEPNGHRIRCLFLADNKINQSKSINPQIYSEIVSKDLAINVIKNGKQMFYHHNNCKNELNQTRGCEHVFINVDKLGDPSSFEWLESEHKYWPIGRQLRQNLINVYYSALNFRDIMLSNGNLKADALPGNVKFSDSQLGMEYSGRDENGRRVMGIVPAKALATTVISVDGVDNDFLWTVPDKWSLEEASTVPMAYSTAYYALIVRGRLKSGETVLIHSGAGAVGEAAIRIVLQMGCNVFTTVSNRLEQNYLMSLFPQLTESQFTNSCDTSFESHIMKATNGKGVDIVFNTLSEEKFQAGLRCLTKHGRFLDIRDNFEMNESTHLKILACSKNISFHCIRLNGMLENDQGANFVEDKRIIKQLLSDGISSGAVIPIQRTVFDVKQTEDAFRFMASGKHIEKVVIKLRDEEPGPQKTYKKLLVKARPRTIFFPNKFYLIIGGLGGFGLQLIRWMIENGAKKLIINSRSGLNNDYQRSCIDRCRQLGARIVVTRDDMTKYEQVSSLIDRLGSSIERLGGIFNLAMILRDGILENQNRHYFDSVCQAKIMTTTNLDSISRQKCQSLDYFVVFSSIVSGRGNAGQSNYGFANSSIERICEQRRSDGLYGLAIQWGAIGDVGVVAENMGEKDVVIAGSVPQKINSCLEVLDRFLQSSESVLCSHVRAVREEETEVVTKELNLMEKICKVLGIRDHSGVSPTTTLAEMGMDSLMVYDVKHIFEAIGKNYSDNELRNITINDILSIK